MKSCRVFLAISGLALFASGANPRGHSEPAINPDSYPGMSEEELGQFRWALKVADQPLNDYRNMEGIDQLGMTSYRYFIAFSTYFLAVEQYQKLPACPELIQPRMERLVKKMVEKPVWEFWAGVSRGIPALEPKLNKPYPEEHDPVGHRNIMYSGHVGHMIGIYEMLYRDFQWDQPGSIVFKWSESEKYLYDHRKLNQVMYDQMMRKPHCIECEPNACFPECNQHPILSFRLHDYLHATGFRKAEEPFFNFFLEKKMINPVTHQTAMDYLIKQDTTISSSNPRFKNPLDLVVTPLASLRLVAMDSASANGWTGSFMHAWQPEYIERHYPYQKQDDLKPTKDDQAKLAATIWEPELKYGFFAMYAGELGDFETRDRLLRYADRKYQPLWEDGAFRYPYSRKRKCTNLTGQLLAIARANPKSGLWAMHNQPFDQAHFAEPKVAGVDFPNLLLRRAIYDRARKALIVTAEPGGKKSQAKTTIKLANLDPEKSYRLFMDGRELAKSTSRTEIPVEITLDGKHNIILAE